ncbi:hypothetical protein [Celeribacter baekdonensis]|uniref:hypothetical protein n=1 Tax=Celeribacter baekdonensis TaxID=875171 RepID=UPI0030D82BE0
MTMLSDPLVPVDPACDVVCDSALAWLRAGVISALRSDRLYIGALGPIRPDAKCALKGAGGSDAQIAHLHAPVGLGLHAQSVGLGLRAQSPAEIVISILAQVIQVLRRP